MATFYPLTPSDGTPYSERQVWEALKQLPNSWRVFHSVAWQVPKKNRVFDGETDYVLLHRRYGFIILEVKGGRIEVKDGTWYSTSRSGESHRLPHSPFDQAKRAMYDLRTYIDEAAGAGEIPCTRAVVFPDMTHPGALGPDAPAEQILARDELSDIAPALEKLVAYAKLDANLEPEAINSITKLLAPTRKLTLQLKTTVAESVRAIIELTDRQVQLLDFLRRQRRALITGVAGTGKTILAIERARRLALEGHHVLLICYNRPLGDHIADNVADESIRVGSFHRFALDLVRRAGFVAGFDPDQEWWKDELPNLLPQASERLGETFDAIVIDEGQDFLPQWFTALQYLLADPDDSPLYVFYDEKQTIYVEEWEPPFEAEPFPLDTNCRNTKPIAEKVARVVGIDSASLGAAGSDPWWIGAESEDEIRAHLDTVVGGLVKKERIEPSQIVVLTDRRALADSLKGDSFGGVKFHALGAKTGSTVETVHRFKGLESDVLILILTAMDSPRDRALAYIGISRARAVLVVIGSHSIKGEVDW